MPSEMEPPTYLAWNNKANTKMNKKALSGGRQIQRQIEEDNHTVLVG